MLRHYDGIGLLTPDAVDNFTGYRYYSESQLPLAGRIQALKNLGFGLSIIGEILKKYEDAGEMERFLMEKRQEMADTEQELLGNSFNIYHVSPSETEKPEDYVTEVCCPVKKRQPV